jgi:prepilin-type N-terminal cleavage/methylation domain-containing protein
MRASWIIGTMKHHLPWKSGFTLVEIMIVVAIIGMLAAIALPNFVRARATARRNACIANLKEIDAAKQEWALENKEPDTAVPTESDLIGAKAYIKDPPSCPLDPKDSFSTSYSINADNVNPTCQVGAAEGHVIGKKETAGS